jgi:hypothetical protein
LLRKSLKSLVPGWILYISDTSDGIRTGRFGLWNVRNLYRVGSLMTVSRELSRYKLDLVGVQEVRWEGGGIEPVGEYTFFYGKGNENHELCTGFFVHKRFI